MKKFLSIAFTLLFVFGLFAQDGDESKGRMAEAAKAMREKNFREAEEIYRSILHDAPEDISVKQLLCHALINEKKYMEADSMLRRMLEADTNNNGTYWYMGISAMSQNQDSIAIGCYKYYIRKTENNPNQKVKAWLYVGSAYRRLMHVQGLNQTKFDDMLYHYKKYLGLNPYDAYAGELQKFIDKVTSKRPDESGILIWDETN